MTLIHGQCSAFLAQLGVELVECALTNVAFAEYHDGAEWDGVLVAPGYSVNEGEYEIVEKKTANPNNFTSFVSFVSSRAFEVKDLARRSWITGVTMPSFGASLSDSVQAFFERLLGNVVDLCELTKLIFVLKRTANVGLLFEGVRLLGADLLDAEEQEQGTISIYEEAGLTETLYTEQLEKLFAEKFPALQNADFIIHRGINTCLFVCPPLGLYTHGYEVETVEPVVRFYISRLFQCWDEGVKCTAEQNSFFERHAERWREMGSEFLVFTNVSAI